MMTIYGNSSGFDPSLFHDDDGRKYLVNMLWDHRPGHNPFAGIVLQEYSVAHRALIGSRTVIFTGTPIGFTEGPHLYKRDGWYYLLTAEGGTGWGHAAKFHYFYASHDETHGKHLRVMSFVPDQIQTDAFTAPTPIEPGAYGATPAQED